MAMEYHVSKLGNDKNLGDSQNPFLTINHAAQIAVAGDTVIVHSGEYREWVNPKNSGESDEKRITYTVAQGEKSTIKGSEIITDWTEIGDGVWKKEIANSFFGDFNPYKEQISGDWFFDLGRVHHLGEVFIDGKALYEVECIEKVLKTEPLENARYKEDSCYTWYSEVTDTTTTLWANFHEKKPNESLIEITTKPRCFFPKETGVNYITLSGFTISQAATGWAPPTAFQDGMVGPHWSKGWIIENNVLSDAKCNAISLGKNAHESDNAWMRKKYKHGTQTQKESIFFALNDNWDMENIGSHIVRNNVISECEQTGICGNMGAVGSIIENNHIYNINHKKQFSGFEIAGIKFHAAIDVEIKNNHIHDSYSGIWLDWQAQGARVSSNLLYRNEWYDFFVEVSHGPTLVDNNIFLSHTSIRQVSQGGAYVNNLFGGGIYAIQCRDRYTPYHVAHSTKIAGFMSVCGGDDRYYNNIFANSEILTDGAEKAVTNGLVGYDLCPTPGEEWWENLKGPLSFTQARFPVFCANNVHIGYSKPYREEKNSLVFTGANATIEVITENDEVFLEFDFGNACQKGLIETQIHGTDTLGFSLETDQKFEKADGTPIAVDTDYFGKARTQKNPTIGPFENISSGKQKIKVF